MNPRAQEIFKEISEWNWLDIEGQTQKVRAVSPAKLATYLAELEERLVSGSYEQALYEATSKVH